MKEKNASLNKFVLILSLVFSLSGFSSDKENSIREFLVTVNFQELTEKLNHSEPLEHMVVIDDSIGIKVVKDEESFELEIKELDIQSIIRDDIDGTIIVLDYPALSLYGNSRALAVVDDLAGFRDVVIEDIFGGRSSDEQKLYMSEIVIEDVVVGYIVIDDLDFFNQHSEDIFQDVRSHFSNIGLEVQINKIVDDLSGI